MVFAAGGGSLAVLAVLGKAGPSGGAAGWWWCCCLWCGGCVGVAGYKGGGGRPGEASGQGQALPAFALPARPPASSKVHLGRVIAFPLRWRNSKGWVGQSLRLQPSAPENLRKHVPTGGSLKRPVVFPLWMRSEGRGGRGRQLPAPKARPAKGSEKELGKTLRSALCEASA